MAAHTNQVISDRQRSNSHNFTGSGIAKFKGGISGQSAGGYNRGGSPLKKNNSSVKGGSKQDSGPD